MITDENVRQFFQNCQKYLKEYWQDDLFSQLPATFWRGVTSGLGKKASPVNCKRNKLVFETYNIIPKYCFSCYKIQIQPRTVVELFKLMIILEKMSLLNDNARKCMVESRPQVSGRYNGFIYSRNLKEAKNIFNKTRLVISEEISTSVPVTLKRGCSEFSLVHSKFSQLDKNLKPVMRYKNEWQIYEDLADKTILGADSRFPPENYNQPGFTLNDAIIMLTWLKYAATIEDLSYLKITERPVSKLRDLKRPTFEPVIEDENKQD